MQDDKGGTAPDGCARPTLFGQMQQAVPSGQPLATMPAPVWPDWYRPTVSRGPKTDRLVMMGLHPFGRPLGPEGTTCGSCAHLTTHRGAAAWWKCKQHLQGHTARTDVHRRWRGCELWRAAEGGE